MEFIAFSPEEIAEKFAWSPRHVRKLAREIGACRILGNRMVLLEEDVKAILDATKPQPTSTARRAKRSQYDQGSHKAQQRYPLPRALPRDVSEI